MKLRTLKDINFMKQFEVKDELRAEAVKNMKIISDPEAKGWIKWFFNLSEEDLA